ncbi:MAG: YmfQ family protein [Myxococcales bacterium]|jgi:uncharacterized protein YmfQ (DUF2313 family)
MDAAAYARQLKQLLPQGRVWNLEPDSWLSKLLLGIADELARIDGRGEGLLDEWNPATASETLDDWERVLGITPPAGATGAERRVAVAAKYVARGGQTAAYFVSLAERLGFVATVATVEPYIWRMTVDMAASTAPYSVRVQEFRAGASRAGDRVRSWTVPELEGPINEAKPAHTRALFAYQE